MCKDTVGLEDCIQYDGKCNAVLSEKCTFQSKCYKITKHPPDLSRLQMVRCECKAQNSSVVSTGTVQYMCTVHVLVLDWFLVPTAAQAGSWQSAVVQTTRVTVGSHLP